MKITGNGNNRIDVAKIYNDNKPKPGASSEKNGKKYDAIEISNAGSEIAKYVTMAKEVSDVRMQKVNEIKEKIQSGMYKVSSEELASKILETINEGKK